MRFPRLIRIATYVIAIVAVAAAGVYVGRIARKAREAPGETIVEAPMFPFETGSPFPDEALVDSTGAMVHTGTIAAAAGAVFLFVDPECEACQYMCRRWEDAIAGGRVDVQRVAGISRASAAATNSYRATHALSFPIHRDEAQAFLTRHAVTRYPLEVIVGTSGRVRAISYDSTPPVDAAALNAQLAQ